MEEESREWNRNEKRHREPLEILMKGKFGPETKQSEKSLNFNLFYWKSNHRITASQCVPVQTKRGKSAQLVRQEKEFRIGFSLVPLWVVSYVIVVNESKSFALERPDEELLYNFLRRKGEKQKKPKNIIQWYYSSNDKEEIKLEERKKTPEKHTNAFIWIELNEEKIRRKRGQKQI